MPRSAKLTRRDFLKGAAVAAAAPYVIPASALGEEGRPAPSNRITMACIGLGGEGMGKNLRSFLGQPDAQVLAVCDVDSERLSQGRSMTETQYAKAAASGTYKGCTATRDFRELLDRKDIDAVMISTPDHWHCLMSAMFLKAGKDVQCEKPTLTVEQGRIVADTVKRYGAVFQTSTEDRSLPMYHRIAELVRNGRVGKVQRIYVKLPSGPGSAGDPTPKPIPDGFDYDLWLGPAPWAPYTPQRIHWNFRWISDYSAGMLADWGMHLLDTAQWGNNTDRSGPVTVEGTGKRHTGGLYDTFYEFHLRYTYANGVEMFVDSTGAAVKFEGTDGWVGSDGWTAPVQASSPEILKSVIGPGELHLYTCPGGEHRNFLDCVKTRREPYFPAEIGHRCATVCHIGNVAMWTGRKLRWDPVTERFPDDDGANAFLRRPMRAPWRM